MTRTLTRDEMDELVEHLSSRPDIWLYHQNVWLRQIGVEEYGLALLLRNGIAQDLYAITHKALTWNSTVADDYVLWLLEKYTAYSLRMKIVEMLEAHALPIQHVETLSRDLCNLQGGAFVRKFERP